MYKFPRDLDLSHLVGTELIEVAIGPYALQLKFEPTNHINIEGRWSLTSPSGAILDQGNQQEKKDSYRIHQLLQKKVVGFTVEDPSTLDVQFEGNWHLKIFDDSEKYESVSISPNIHI